MKNHLIEIMLCPIPQGVGRWGRLWSHVLCLVIVLGNLPVGILAYWAWIDPLYPVLEFLDSPHAEYEPNPPRIRVDFNSIKHRDCRGWTVQVLMDSRGESFPLPTLATFRPPGVYRDATTYRLLPNTLPPGRYHYAQVNEYACNPLQYVWPLRYPLPAVDFEVFAP